MNIKPKNCWRCFVHMVGVQRPYSSVHGSGTLYPPIWGREDIQKTTRGGKGTLGSATYASTKLKSKQRLEWKLQWQPVTHTDATRAIESSGTKCFHQVRSGNVWRKTAMATICPIPEEANNPVFFWPAGHLPLTRKHHQTSSELL